MNATIQSRAIRCVQALLLCLIVGGCCVPEPPPRVRRPDPKRIRYGRVAIIEFLDKSGYPDAARQLGQSLRDKLTERSKDADVFFLPRSAFPSLGDPFSGGTIPVEVLVKARRDYRADALVLGSLDAHDPYPPPSAHVSLKVVDTATAAVPHERSSGWNGREEAVRDAVDRYYRTYVGSDDCRLGPNVFLVSPSYFLKFVAATLADGIAAALE